VTNAPVPWLEFMQKTCRDDLAGMKGGQLRDYLAGNYKTGSGIKKRLALHYKLWQKVVLPESEARQHLALCPLSEQLARRAGSLPPQAPPAAPTIDPAPPPAAGGEVCRTVHDARFQPPHGPFYRVEIGYHRLRWRPDFDAAPPSASQALPAARPTDPTSGPAATEEVCRTVHDARFQPPHGPFYRLEIGARTLRWRPDFDAAPPSPSQALPAARPTDPTSGPAATASAPAPGRLADQMSSPGECLPVRVRLAFGIAPCGELWAKESFVVALRYVRVKFAYKMAPNHYTAQKIRCAA
jgi:hypothetical protein